LARGLMTHTFIFESENNPGKDLSRLKKIFTDM